MTIENLGVKLYSGTKQDRKSDSLGSSADGANTGITLANQKLGTGCLSLDGTDDYVELGSATSSFNFFHGTSDWSINFWVKYNEFVAEDRFFDNISASENNGITIRVGSTGNSKLGLSIKSSNGWMSNTDVNFPSTITLGEWVMITVTCDYSDTTNTYKIYVNGSAGGTVGRGSTGSSNNADTTMKLGRRGYNSTKFFDGLIDDVAMWNSYTLTQSEINLLYNSGSGAVATTVSTGGTIYSHYPFDTNADDTQNNNDGTNYGGTIGAIQKLGTQGCYSFDGSDSYTTASSWGETLSDKGTVACWFNADSLASSRTIISQRINGSGNPLMVRGVDSDTIELRVGNTNAPDFTSTISTGTWYHVAVTWDRTADVVKGYLNGVLEVTSTSNGTDFTGTSGDVTAWTFGQGYNTDSGRAFTGKVDDAGVWSRILTTTEIGKLANNNQVGLTSNVASYIFNDQANSRLKFVVKRGQGSGISGWIDTGLTSSSSNWAIKFKLNVPTRSVGGNNTGYFGFSSSTVNQDSDYTGKTGNVIGYYINLRTSGETAAHGQQAVQAGNTYSYNLINDANSLQFSDGSTAYIKWIKIVKNGNTVNMTIHDSESDADSNTLTSGSDTATGTNATAGAFTNLRYLKWYNVAGGSTDEATIYFSDLKLYDNTTATSGTPTKNYTFVEGDAQLVSSLSDKSNLKAYYSMDSTSISSTLDITSNSGFTANVTGITTDSNGKITNAGTGCTANTGVWKSLGFTLGSTWCCTYRYKRIGGGSPNDNWSIPISFTSSGTNASGNASASNDAVGHYSDSNINAFYKDGASSVSGTYTGEGATLNTYYYIKMIRTTSTNLQFKIYNNSDFSDTPTTYNKTISGISDDLTYLFAGAGVNNNTWGFEVDQIKIFNNATDNQGCVNDFSATSALEALTGTRTNSIFQQTDTPSYWWYNGTSWVLDGTTQNEPSLTNSAIWSMVGNQGSATTSLTGGKLRINQATNSGSSSDSGCVAVFDTGSATDKFVMRFNFTTGSSHTDGGGNAVCYWGFSSNDSYSSTQGFVTGQSGNSADCVAFRWHIYSNKTRVGSWDNGSLTWGTEPNENLTFTNSTTYYWELSYDGTSVVLKRFTDSTYSSPAHTGTYTLAGRTGMKYFVMGNTYDTQGGVFTIDHNKIEIQKGRSTWLE